MCAYNGHNFDGPVLLQQLTNHGIEDYGDVIEGFADPYIYIKKNYPTGISKWRKIFSF